MKKIFILLLLLIIGGTSCLNEYSLVYTANSPIYMSYEELRSSVKFTEANNLNNPGKIYFKDDYIFINEQLKGVHIIDNSSTSNPTNIGFIKIPGNIDISIKNNILYADSYIDLVTIDISDLDNIEEVKREEDVFAYAVPEAEDDDYPIANIDIKNGVVTGWEVKKVREEIEYNNTQVYYFYTDNYTLEYSGIASSWMSSSGSTVGIGGSMARFGLYDDYLYSVDETKLYIFDISTDSNPQFKKDISVGSDIETMFIFDKHIFFGKQTGMSIYSLEDPENPSYISNFMHVTSCDPVVISDGYAYITLRGGNVCGGITNRLDVLELSENYNNNTLLASYDLEGPYGLGIDDQTLFICDGDSGLKVYDATDKYNIDDYLIAQFPEINAYDVIPVNGNLFMIGKDGFYQYDYSNLQDISLLSFIKVE